MHFYLFLVLKHFSRFLILFIFWSYISISIFRITPFDLNRNERHGRHTWMHAFNPFGMNCILVYFLVTLLIRTKMRVPSLTHI